MHYRMHIKSYNKYNILTDTQQKKRTDIKPINSRAEKMGHVTPLPLMGLINPGTLSFNSLSPSDAYMRW